MKVIIIYFSGTGSTAKIANDIGKRLIENGNEVDFLFAKRDINYEEYDLNSYDLIGVGCPTYSFRAPRLFTKILNSLDFSNIPSFIFYTCGGMGGNTFRSLAKYLYKKNSKIIGALEVISSNNLRSWRPKMNNPEPSNDGFLPDHSSQCLEFADLLLPSYQEIIEKQIKKPLKFNINILWAIFSVFATHSWQMRFILGKKRVIEDKCTKCGLCETHICPSGCISIGELGYPIFNESKCVGCQGCVSVCPTLAIETKKCKGKHPYTLYKKYMLKSLPID